MLNSRGIRHALINTVVLVAALCFLVSVMLWCNTKRFCIVSV